MSWGEESCVYYGYCKYNPTLRTCNTDCKHYKDDTFIETLKEQLREQGMLDHNDRFYVSDGDYVSVKTAFILGLV